MENKGNLKEILQVLYRDLDSDNPQDVLDANDMLDKILGDTFNIHPISLFLYDIRKKDCIQNLRKLLSGGEVTDFEIAKAISSLITHLIIATEKDIRRYQYLKISDIILLLNSFICGDIDRPEIINFFNKYM